MNIKIQIAKSIKEVLPLYHSDGRVYHDWSHIMDCLHQLEIFKSANPDVSFKSISTPSISQDYGYDILTLAILWHDAVYFPFRSDNEKMSAALYCATFQREVNQEVTSLILGTDYREEMIKLCPGDIYCHEEVGKNEVYLHYLLHDIDHSILGSATYHDYETFVRREYTKFISLGSYQFGRKCWLEKMLAKPHIFVTDFYSQFEAKARQNLQSELDSLLDR